jgi:predicted 2-oxoglutarate/Fe(II)-dependent dioxygenase YbiX
MEYILEPALEPDEIYAGAICLYKNFLPDSQGIINAYESEINNPETDLSFGYASTMTGSVTSERRNLISGITYYARLGNPVAREIHNTFGMALDRALNGYSKKFETAYTLHEDYGLLKYRGEHREHYDAHFDGDTSTGRAISAVYYLNDNYDGGEIDFGHHGIKIKPEAGTLVLFPSNYAYSHIACEVTKGIKYAIVTWIHDRL